MKSIGAMLGAIAVIVVAGCSADQGMRSGSNSERDSNAIGQSGNVCRKTGCSSQICADHDVASDCEWRPEYACYGQANCELQAYGECGFTEDEALRNCLGQALDGGSAPDAGNLKPCHHGGCSSQVCTDRDDLVTTCEWRPEYACYQQATCERQADGQCSFAVDEKLTNCLAAAADAGNAP